MKQVLAISNQLLPLVGGSPIMFFMGSYANSHVSFSCCIAEKWKLTINLFVFIKIRQKNYFLIS
jgi:hypothetical protein